MLRFDDYTHVQLYSILKSAFPDARISDADLVALGLCLRHGIAHQELPPSLERVDLSPYDAELDEVARSLNLPELEKTLTPRRTGDTTRYYWVEAKHTRRNPTGFEPFVGELAMARVTLPQRRPKAFETCIGTVGPGDHLIDTVLEANQKYGRHLPQAIERLDVITPARQDVRFGAISVFLGYAQWEATEPFCYILEAGTATGEPKVLYLGRDLDVTINAYAGYQPTPFACPDHAYTGKLTVEGDEPRRLRVTSRKIEDGKSLGPYIDIDVQFTPQSDQISSIWPGFLIARAAAIVLLRQISGRIDTDCASLPPLDSA